MTAFDGNHVASLHWSENRFFSLSLWVRSVRFDYVHITVDIIYIFIYLVLPHSAIYRDIPWNHHEFITLKIVLYINCPIDKSHPILDEVKTSGSLASCTFAPQDWTTIASTAHHSTGGGGSRRSPAAGTVPTPGCAALGREFTVPVPISFQTAGTSQYSMAFGAEWCRSEAELSWWYDNIWHLLTSRNMWSSSI
jgi:hypothetical protein